MNTLIAKNPINFLNPQSSNSVLLFQFPLSYQRNRYSSFLSSRRKWMHGSKLEPLKFYSLEASCAPCSTSYGGWDDLRTTGASDGPGESDVFRNFLVSVGIDDKKYIFVFLLGIICALAISRVKVSSIVFFPACVLVFAIGFTIGFFRNGSFNDVSVIGSKRREKQEIFKLYNEKLRNLVEIFDGIDGKVNNLKNDIQNAIANNEIRLGDLKSYVEVTNSLSLSALNARDVTKTLIENEGNSNGALFENHKISKRKKDVGEIGYNLLRYVGGLLKENLVVSNTKQVKEMVEQDTLKSSSNQTGRNNFTPPVEERSLNSVNNNKGSVNLDASQDSSSNSALNEARNMRLETASENNVMNFGEMDGRAESSINKTDYAYQKGRLRFKNNQSFSLEMDYNNKTNMPDSHHNLLDSADLGAAKNAKAEASFVHEKVLKKSNGSYLSSHEKKMVNDSYRSKFIQDSVNCEDDSHLADHLSAHENQIDSSLYAKISDDMVFDKYLSEATGLLKQAKGCIKGRHDEEHAEIMLNRSAKLLSEAVGLKPMSLLAVGQLGNTYLLQGELKLKISRELRILLSGSSPFPVEKQGRMLNRVHKRITSKDEVASLLIDVCEECEELLVEAGRKYRLALSIDGNDVRALYNWGIALSFRGQLIADIGPGAAVDADMVFLAAIDKFDAMMSRGNVYAPDALFRWGTALQQRSYLRPSSSKEKVKLLLQAKRLYQDALCMDSNNVQVRDALASCISELNYRQF
ncbi:Tetratricopeptide-like helical [Quillaja saponaria]|uniref:Tetratricopeptide-like helical n=1 Tax=Quillaja saponaria TaxID=32244 RepID=A0AAD7LEG3_QUISA|nr:Tetratricopeptide-like helical [Quillaja saponaria]